MSAGVIDAVFEIKKHFMTLYGLWLTRQFHNWSGL
ncbi:hypothetical protein Milano_101 [Agrobacterium phage Milano]|nr:hypothetical protein Milano_101 [Agrobacterium phage Milano]